MFSTPSTRVYVDPETLFSVEVPPGWLVDNSGQQGPKVILLCPRLEMGFRPNLNVLVQQLGGLSLEDFLTLTRLQLKQLTGQQTPDRDEAVARPAGAHLLEWTAPMGAFVLKARQLTVVDQGRAYILTATAPASGFPKYAPDFQTVFDSFTVSH